jgi:hypothetical protein
MTDLAEDVGFGVNTAQHPIAIVHDDEIRIQVAQGLSGDQRSPRTVLASLEVGQPTSGKHNRHTKESPGQ